MKEVVLDDLKKISLDILLDVHDFCTQNNIGYSLYGGTMIGAIRHKGFIPWDDDIDIAMLRPDYERFLRTYKSKKGYKLFHAHNSNSLIGFARVCEIEKTFATYPRAPWIDKETGVWIDVFPLDVAPDDELETNTHINELKDIQAKIYRLRNAKASIYKMQNIRGFLHYIKNFGYRLTLDNPMILVYDFISKCQKYALFESKHFCNFSYTGFGIKEYQLLDDFSSFISVSFEGHDFLCCNGYDRLMKTKYGNYMELPPIEKQVSHHPMKIYWKK